ncbi:MAG: AMP-binding protein [Oscillospiraceae bacterium]|jgi:amino acid adenylation domain-containing protein|nr:AMP-binding protein [Oscillospiraceae bacterium]
MIENLLDRLEQTTQRCPEHIAFFDDRDSLTFAQFQAVSMRIGSALAAVTKPRTAVALLLDARSIRNLPAMFGALYAGCAYAPLDITMPPERLALLLSLMAPAAIVADERGRKALDACAHGETPVFAYDEAAQTPINESALLDIREQISPYDPASILYTSGSTGIPKGSIQTHFSYIIWASTSCAMYGLTERSIFGNQSPFFYANSIFDIFPTLTLGASTYLLPAGALTFPKKLIDCLNANHVTDICMTPSSFISVVGSGALTPGCLPELTGGYMSGEVMPFKPLSVWMQATPKATWWNFYGSTELFSIAVGRVRTDHQEGDRLPVGKSFPLVHVLFVDENGDEVPEGQPGEMLVASPWIARGYYRDAERTAAAWSIDPLGRGWHERFFHTGDVGYRRADGQLVVLGRRDTQIKHMGYRMELGEVEVALRKIPGWADGCVLFDRDKDQIWCFFTGALTEKELKQALKAQLARYMLPDVFVHLDELPHTASMKIDRAQLTAIMKKGV